MNTLHELIKAMDRHECRQFKLLANRTNQSAKRKDLILFDYCRKHNKDYNEKKIAKKLYGDNINAFYRLKSRLYNDLKNSLTLSYLNKDEELAIYKQLFIAKLLSKKGLEDISHKVLTDAEKIASQKNLFDLLKLIYDEKIKIYHRNGSLNIESLLQKRKENRSNTNRIQEIDDVLAALNFKLRKSQNYNFKDDETLVTLENTVKEFIVDHKLMENVKMKLKIYQSISSILLQKHDFKSLENYLQHTYKDFLKNNVFNQKNHNIKLQMITYHMNCLCKNEKHVESLEKADLLNQEMKKFNNLHYNKYLFYYYNGLAINYNKLNKEKAIEVLLNAKNEEVIVNSDYNYFFVCSNLALQYFDVKKYKSAIKTLSRIILHRSFLTFDSSFRIKIVAAELIIRYEIGDFDYLEERMKQIKKRYKNILANDNYIRESLLLKIIQKLIYTQNINQEEELIADIHLLLSKASAAEAENDDIVNYNKWLLKKLS
tara:strand:- start:201 stop:1658 length:1458 start_codon:yes stop_codon:yes gene_type:complete